MPSINTGGCTTGDHFQLDFGVAGAADKNKRKIGPTMVGKIQSGEPARFATPVTGIEENEIRQMLFQSLDQFCFLHASTVAGDVLFC